jgi:predicted metal-dependent phosphoesterase TrpH
MKIDLHIHTMASDGTWSPEELVENIKKAEIGIFSVTDHDSTDNVLQTADLAKADDLHFIPGVEINASRQNKYIHILSYGIDIECEALKDVLAANKRFIEEKSMEVILFLGEKGYPVSKDEYRDYINNPARGGWKTFNYLKDKGLCNNHNDFFDLFRDNGNPFENIGYVSPEEAISAVKTAGGMPVLAHPGAKIYTRPHDAIVDLALELGVKGIECYHPENSVEVTQYCREVCKKHNLLITGGSDCHGEFVKERRLGKPDIDLEQLEIEGML